MKLDHVELQKVCRQAILPGTGFNKFNTFKVQSQRSRPFRSCFGGLQPVMLASKDVQGPPERVKLVAAKCRRNVLMP